MHPAFEIVAGGAQIAQFLASDGRRVQLATEPAATTAPAWYQVYGASRK